MSTITHDLARWEAGELTSSELEMMHPAHEIDALVALDAQLIIASAEVAVPVSDGWGQLAATLPDWPAPFVQRVKRRLRRPVALGLVGTVLSTSAAVAAVPPVRRAVVSTVSDVTQFFFGEGADRRVPMNDVVDREAPAIVPADETSAGAVSEDRDGSPGTKFGKDRRQKSASSDGEPEQSGESSGSGTTSGTSDSGSSSDSSSDSSSGGGSYDESQDSSTDSSQDGTDTSSDESTDSSSDGTSSDSSSDSSWDCSSDSGECWDGTPPDPDDY